MYQDTRRASSDNGALEGVQARFVAIVAELTQQRFKPAVYAGAGHPPDKTHLLIGLQNDFNNGADS